MPKNKRLHFKDINAIKAFAFFPIYLLCVSSLITAEDNAWIGGITNIFAHVAKSSIDFFFFLTSFLVTSHALREYKYMNSFSYRNFLIRRLLRLGVVLLLALLFAFLLYPWLERVLALDPKATINSSGFALLIPNYRLNLNAVNQPVFMVVIASLFMFIQFYIVWGAILKLFKKYLKIVGFILVALGVVVRILYVSWDQNYYLDTLAYGVPLGIGVLTAQLFRSNHSLFEKMKDLSKRQNIIIYVIGITIALIGYLFTANTWSTAFIPILNSVFFGYLFLEQTFGRNSFIQLKNKKILTYIGKISYGIIVYQSIIGAILMIAAGSLVFDILSTSSIALIVVASFIGSIVVADISYRLFEKPLLRVRREFKKV